MDNGRFSVESRDSANPKGSWYAEGWRYDRASRVCIKEEEGAANGSQESSWRGWNSFRPRLRLDMQTTKRLQCSLASFFPLYCWISNPCGGRVETWEWKLAGDADTVRSFTRETTGNDVSAKVTIKQGSLLHFFQLYTWTFSTTNSSITLYHSFTITLSSLYYSKEKISTANYSSHVSRRATV